MKLFEVTNVPNYHWKNKQTQEVVEILRSIAERDVPPDESGDWERLLQAPTVLKATYLDGQRAKSDQSYDKLKKAAQLKIDYANEFSGSKERVRLDKEIKKLEEVK